MKSSMSFLASASTKLTVVSDCHENLSAVLSFWSGIYQIL